MNYLKDALLVYRNLVQNSSPQALQVVLERLRIKVEEKVSKNMSEASSLVEKLDLEVEDPPEVLLLNSVKESNNNAQ